MVLAAAHFKSVLGETAQFVRQSRLMKLFREFDKHIKFVVHLVSILKVTELTQENVSCLNTSLVILMLARRENKLARLLHNLSQHEHGNPLLSNMRNLLQFWQQHYLHKDKDCSTLEKSSLIPFSYWKSTVALLTCDQESSTTAILHYIRIGQSGGMSLSNADDSDNMDTDDF